MWETRVKMFSELLIDFNCLRQSLSLTIVKYNPKGTFSDDFAESNGTWRKRKPFRAKAIYLEKFHSVTGSPSAENQGDFNIESYMLLPDL